MIFMSRYLPLFWDLRQIPALLYRIYINIFGIFLGIPILPLSIDFKYKTFDIWYKGTTVICYFKKGRLRYQAIIGGGLDVGRLEEIDKFWKEYEEAEFHSYLRDFKDNSNYLYLKEGDIWEEGDEYSDGKTLFVIGENTGIGAGQIVSREVLCYNPRRFKKIMFDDFYITGSD